MSDLQPKSIHPHDSRSELKHTAFQNVTLDTSTSPTVQALYTVEATNMVCLDYNIGALCSQELRT